MQQHHCEERYYVFDSFFYTQMTKPDGMDQVKKWAKVSDSLIKCQQQCRSNVDPMSIQHPVLQS
jgi:hypothetical protein